MSRIKLPWKNFSRRVARNDLVRCVITAVNSDGSYDVRRVGVAEGVADIKRVPSVTKNDVYLVGDIASLGFVEGDPQKPFLFGFVNGGAKHISVVVNPILLNYRVIGVFAVAHTTPTGGEVYNITFNSFIYYHPPRTPFDEASFWVSYTGVLTGGAVFGVGVDEIFSQSEMIMNNQVFYMNYTKNLRPKTEIFVRSSIEEFIGREYNQSFIDDFTYFQSQPDFSNGFIAILTNLTLS